MLILEILIIVLAIIVLSVPHYCPVYGDIVKICVQNNYISLFVNTYNRPSTCPSVQTFDTSAPQLLTAIDLSLGTFLAWGEDEKL